MNGIVNNMLQVSEHYRCYSLTGVQKEETASSVQRHGASKGREIVQNIPRGGTHILQGVAWHIPRRGGLALMPRSDESVGSMGQLLETRLAARVSMAGHTCSVVPDDNKCHATEDNKVFSPCLNDREGLYCL